MGQCSCLHDVIPVHSLASLYHLFISIIYSDSVLLKTFNIYTYCTLFLVLYFVFKLCNTWKIFNFDMSTYCSYAIFTFLKNFIHNQDLGYMQITAKQSQTMMSNLQDHPKLKTKKDISFGRILLSKEWELKRRTYTWCKINLPCNSGCIKR